MAFFEKKPIRRLLFVITYIVFAIWITVDSFAWGNIICSILILFGAYIALVKSKIITDKYVNAIDDYKFDISSILLTIYFFTEIVIKNVILALR